MQHVTNYLYAKEESFLAVFFSMDFIREVALWKGDAGVKLFNAEYKCSFNGRQPNERWIQCIA